jgi:hypothetical protein
MDRKVLIDERRLFMLAIKDDLCNGYEKAVRKVGWHLGVVIDHPSGERLCLASKPALDLDIGEHGEVWVSPRDIAEDCLRAIDELKTRVILLNRLAHDDLSPPEREAILTDTADYLSTMIPLQAGATE